MRRKDDQTQPVHQLRCANWDSQVRQFSVHSDVLRFRETKEETFQYQLSYEKLSAKIQDMLISISQTCVSC
jgi:hypothetical protein